MRKSIYKLKEYLFADAHCYYSFLMHFSHRNYFFKWLNSFTTFSLGTHSSPFLLTCKNCQQNIAKGNIFHSIHFSSFKN